MTISSLSFSFVNVYTTSAAPATVGRPPAAVSKAIDCRHDTDEGHAAGRPNRLTQALAAALREIGIGGAAAAPGTTGTAAPAAPAALTGTAAAPAAAPSTAGDLSAAVEQFADALMDALGAGRSARGRSGEHRQDGEHGRHGHGRRNTRYGDFAQRLESLSKSIVQTPPTAPVASAPPTAVAPVIKAPISLPPTVESEPGVAAPAPAAPAPIRSALSPLLDAFSRLFEALKPAAAADAPATDMASRLQQFLHTMAQTLSRNGSDTAAAPQRGAFIDVRA